MNLSDYFTKVFGKIFHKDIFWPTLVLFLIFGAIIFVVSLIVAGLLVASYGPEVMSMANNNVDPANMMNNLLSSSIMSIFSLVIGLLITVVIVALIMIYLFNVFYVFVTSKIALTESKAKSLNFFQGLGSSFGKGLKLFFAQILYLLPVSILFSIIFVLFALIPILGPIIDILLGILFAIYITIGSWILLGKISSNEKFGESLKQAFVKPFKKFKLWSYAIIFLLVLIVIALISGLLMMIPLLGFIANLFIYTGLLIFACALAYYFAKE